jgi:hypothetical protein
MAKAKFDASAVKAEIEAFKAAKCAPLKEEIAKLNGEIFELESKRGELDKLLAELEGRQPLAMSRRERLAKSGGGKRASAAELATLAVQVVEWIGKHAGKDGASASSLRQAFPALEKQPSLSAFLDKWAKGKAIPKGERRATRYFPA